MSTCEWWVFVAISVVAFILHALLLLTLYIILSRKIVAASRSCGQRASSSPAAQPSTQQPPTSSAGGEGAQRPGYGGSSDTSSETSEDSDSSPSCPQLLQGSRSEENLNYTSLVFPVKGRGSGSAGNYENVKTGADYINVDPTKRKVNFWPCSSPVACKSVEYTEVKL